MIASVDPGWINSQLSCSREKAIASAHEKAIASAHGKAIASAREKAITSAGFSPTSHPEGDTSLCPPETFCAKHGLATGHFKYYVNKCHIQHYRVNFPKITKAVEIPLR